MDILEDEYILSCTDEKVIIFKILGKKLYVKNIFAIGHISSCIAFDSPFALFPINIIILFDTKLSVLSSL